MLIDSAWTISQAESNGTVTKLLGNPYSYGDGSGDASEININTDGLGGLEVDMSTGDIYYTDYSRIYMFDVSENTVTKIHDGGRKNRWIRPFKRRIIFYTSI